MLWDIQTWRLPGLGAAVDQIQSLPRTEFSYRLLSACARLTVGTGGASTSRPNLTLIDGSGLPVFAVQGDMNPFAMAAGVVFLATFAPLPNPLNGESIAVTNGTVRLSIPIPPEFWVLPQNQLQFAFPGANTGSGGDNWNDTTLTVAIPKF